MRVEVSQMLKWKADLSDYDAEIIVHIHFDLLYIAIRASKSNFAQERLSRDYLRSTSLRPSIAYSMLSLAQIKGSETVLDLCCGTCTIGIVLRHLERQCKKQQQEQELQQATGTSHKTGYNNLALLCGDLSAKVLAANAESKLSLAELGIDMLRFDYTNLPFKNESVDVIVSNLPFGIQCSSPQQNRKNYPLLFDEIYRILKRETGRAVLLTSEIALVYHCMRAHKRKLHIYWLTKLKMGGLRVYIICIQKTNKFENEIRREIEELQKQEEEEQDSDNEEAGSTPFDGIQDSAVAVAEGAEATRNANGGNNNKHAKKRKHKQQKKQ